MKQYDEQIEEIEGLIARQEYKRAVPLLLALIEKDEKCWRAQRIYGELMAISPVYADDAGKYLYKAAELAPQEEENWRALARWQQKRGELGPAYRSFHQALSLTRKHHIEYLEKLALLAEELGNIDSSQRHWKELLDRDPQHKMAYLHLIKQYRAENDGEKALETADQMITNIGAKLDEELFKAWLQVMDRYADPSVSVRKFEQLIRSAPENASLLSMYGSVLFLFGKVKEAKNTLLKSIERKGDDTGALLRLAQVYEAEGVFEKATECYEKVLSVDPLNIAALYAYGKRHKYRYEDQGFQNISYALSRIDGLKENERLILHYAAAKAFEDTGEYETAFEHYRIGGKLHAKGRDQAELHSLQKYYKSLKSLDKETFKSIIGDFGDQRPLFIVGMPRSGTTLTEQVLAAFPNIYAAGELPYVSDVLKDLKIENATLRFAERKQGSTDQMEWLERGKAYMQLASSDVPPDTKYIVDKMPHNFQYIGMILKMLPDARFIHLRRHPMEVSLSAYRLLFTKGHYWSDDLVTMGRYYRLYTQIMQYWKSVLPKGSILDVRYEDLVNDLEGESKRIARFIGEEWTPNCLAFHRQKNIVRTASLSQVRQPIYRTSMNRWRKYERYIQPLYEEISNIVENYEDELVKKSSS